MELIGRYVNVEGDLTFSANVGAAVRFIEQPRRDAEIQARNEADARWPFSILDPDSTPNPERDALMDRITAAGLAEAERRGRVLCAPERDGLTPDAASYDAGAVNVTILDEAGFAAYCQGEQN